MAQEQEKARVADQIRLQTEADLAAQAQRQEDAGLTPDTTTSPRKRRAAYQGTVGSVATGDVAATTAPTTGSIRV
jgi:hypothetical protein